MNFFKKYAPVFAAAALLFVLALIMIGSYLVKKYTPSEERANLKEHFSLTEEADMAIIFSGVQQEDGARYIDGHVYLEYSFVRNYINERFYWDNNENLLLYTTATNVITTEPLTADYYEGNKKITGDYGVIVRLEGERVYVNLEYVDAYSSLSYTIYEDPHRLVLENHQRTYQAGEVKKESVLRQKGGIKSPILKDLEKGEVLEVLEMLDKWTKVCTRDGYIGYIQNKYLGKSTQEEILVEIITENFTHKFTDKTICMGWHQVTSQADNRKIQEIVTATKGMTVISPTWFYLNDNTGGIGSLASLDYVDYCHSQGIEVWALVSNFVNSSVDTTKVLTHTSYRQNFVNKIVAKAIEYELDGINLDFESIDKEVGDGYIQLVRELALKCHANGLILSVDNYVPTSYTAFYNRSQQALFADYIIVMAYDEHYVGSDAGSVSSISFVEDGIRNTLKEVPKEQLVVALPFYCRLWEETPVYNDEGDLMSISTSSTAYGISAAQRVVNNYGAEAVWDENCGQYFAQFERDGKIYRIWMEEERSLEYKLQKMKEYELAGVSFWKLGLEREETWNTIIKYVN